MKKGDLEVGKTYAITHSVMKVPPGGVKDMNVYGWGSGTFPMAVACARIDEIDVPVEVQKGSRAHAYTVIEKMIRVTWLPNTQGRVEPPTARTIYHKDNGLMRNASLVLCPWDEYVAVRKGVEEKKHASETEANRNREMVEAAVARLRGEGFSEDEVYSADHGARLVIRPEACQKLIEVLDA